MITEAQTSQMLLYILVILILIVLALLLYSNIGKGGLVLGAGEQRPVLVFTSGGNASSLRQLKSSLASVQTHVPVYNPTKLDNYSNVPIIWTGMIDVGAFQRAHPGVCGGVVLWYPNQMPMDTIPESTFVVQDLSKKGSDGIWEAHSHHRYYISKSDTVKYIQEILSSIR